LQYQIVYSFEEWSFVDEESLSYRIRNQKLLTDEEIAGVVGLIGFRCSLKTKDILERRLKSISMLSNYGIFGRLIVSPKQHYNAGQSYPDEIRTVRELLIKG
jgi:TnpA family transposase